MKVLIGVDPHKASVAVGAIDEATGELYRACQLPTGGHRLEAPPALWAKRFPERRSKRWRTLAASG